MIDVPAYMRRIGYQGDLNPNVATLRGLHLAHLRAVPFENLDIHLGRPIVLEEDLLFDKVVSRRRGGFCYELNGLFAALLRDIGFAVAMLAAQFPLEPGRAGTEKDHLILLVQADDTGTPLLVDIAAGRRSFALPLETATVAAQAQPEAGAAFRLLPEGDRCRLWRQESGGDWERVYAFAWEPRAFADFAEGCHYHQTSPESDFTRKRLCTLMTPTGRITLSERRLITTINGSRGERDLYDDAEWYETLRALFGIDLNA